jgi:hypothetical protein
MVIRVRLIQTLHHTLDLAEVALVKAVLLADQETKVGADTED